jgi:hypothetical protein
LLVRRAPRDQPVHPGQDIGCVQRLHRACSPAIALAVTEIREMSDRAPE